VPALAVAQYANQNHRGLWWGWTPDPRQIGGGTPTPDPRQIGDGDGDGDQGFRALTEAAAVPLAVTIMMIGSLQVTTGLTRCRPAGMPLAE
jgi:hypothetical protein